MRLLQLFFFLTPIFAIAQVQVSVSDGTLVGQLGSDGIRSFKGIPYAAPPVGRLRWRDPQPVSPWKGPRDAMSFAARPMQLPIFDDMIFRSPGMSEDCLYLNIWTPAVDAHTTLPVLIYFYGGGFSAGDGSEPRYDGGSMAKKGIVVVTVNYRLNIFGFFCHPALVAESPTHSAGDYGLMDQHAALVWVQKNIHAFGGDPRHVTIGGESAGARSVSAQMASPLSKGLFTGAIGESGSTVGPKLPALNEAAQQGLQFAAGKPIEELRRIPAQALLDLSRDHSFGVIVDGRFMPVPPIEIYTRGLQMDIPLLAGWNSAEISGNAIFEKAPPTMENYFAAVKKLYPGQYDKVLKQYPADNDSAAIVAATALASDRRVAYNTWKWIDLHAKTNGFPVYRYLFSYPATGAAHASEIPYALGNLPSTADKNAPKISELFQQYLANFIKTGDPNGNGLPRWYGLQSSIPKVMVFDTTAHAVPEQNSRRYQLLDALNGN